MPRQQSKEACTPDLRRKDARKDSHPIVAAGRMFGESVTYWQPAPIRALEVEQWRFSQTPVSPGL